MYLIVRQLEKNNGPKAKAKVVKSAKNKCWVHSEEPPGLLSVENRMCLSSDLN